MHDPDGVLIALCACGWLGHVRETAPHGLPSSALPTRRRLMITVEALHLAPVKSLGTDVSTKKSLMKGKLGGSRTSRSRPARGGMSSQP